jgi:hypothetical protein
MADEWDFGIDELMVMSQLLLIGGLAYVLFCIRQLVVKPPLMIKCDCFNDMSHDDMVKIKEMYKSIPPRGGRPEPPPSNDLEKKVDDLVKED